MKINILTLFSNMFDGFKNESIIKRAIEKNIVDINIINIRDYCYDKHKQADDMPYGGGNGMILKVEPIYRALMDIKKNSEDTFIIYTSPQGKTFNQKLAIFLSKKKDITIIAGHYEGIDQRIIDNFCDLELSIGDYVLTGGELPSMVISDAIIRLLPGVIKKESYENDSFFSDYLDYPVYTRPPVFMNMEVPKILLSGHHANIEKWRRKESIKKTFLKRPELIRLDKMNIEDKEILDMIIKENKREENEK